MSFQLEGLWSSNRVDELAIQIGHRVVLSLLGVHSAHVNDLHDIELVLFVLQMQRFIQSPNTFPLPPSCTRTALP